MSTTCGIFIASMSTIETTKSLPKAAAQVLRPHPIRPPWRVIKVYLVTLRVLGSYLWLRFVARYTDRDRVLERLEDANRRNARRIYRAIVELQGLYIKVGQLFSILSNFLPEVFRKELDGLQDQVPPRPFAEIDRRLRDEFDGRGPDELFETFDETPMASASIGQVHLATLPGGRRVAVKVQYPGIEKIVRADLRTLRRIFALVQRFVSYQKLDFVYREIRAIVLQELDFLAEAKHTIQVAGSFEGSKDVHFPEVISSLTTQRVLTTEFIEGVKVNDLASLDRWHRSQRFSETGN